MRISHRQNSILSILRNIEWSRQINGWIEFVEYRDFIVHSLETCIHVCCIRIWDEVFSLFSVYLFVCLYNRTIEEEKNRREKQRHDWISYYFSSFAIIFFVLSTLSLVIVVPIFCITFLFLFFCFQKRSSAKCRLAMTRRNENMMTNVKMCYYSID